MSCMKQLDARDGARIDDALDAVRIRPYGVTDQERVRRMSGRLSPASLYTRFFSGTPRLPEHYVGLLERLDHWTATPSWRWTATTSPASPSTPATRSGPGAPTSPSWSPTRGSAAAWGPSS